MIQRVITFSFLGAMAVLVIMNAKNFATATNAIASAWITETAVLSGSGYKGGSN